MEIWWKKVEKIVGFSELRSYGAFYGSITTLLGFTADKHEGKITGLAAYGKKTNLVIYLKNILILKRQNNYIWKFFTICKTH